jgi:hypothetical protein
VGCQFLLLSNEQSWVIFLILLAKTNPNYNHWAAKAKLKLSIKSKLKYELKTKIAESFVPWNKPPSRPG